MNQTKMQIVIIEDEYSLRDTLSMLVEELGYDAVAFGSLLEAEALSLKVGCSSGKSRAVFMVDQNLPDGKGLDYIQQRIESGECQCGGRCMSIMSGALMNDELERAKQIGCSILEKPVMFADLKIWLESVSV